MKLGTPGFVGERLRQAREVRGISASALSEIVGVSRAAISQYESVAPNSPSPSPDVMRTLSRVLNLPVQWFLRPMQECKHGNIFYRCLSSATKGARLRAERRYEWLREIVGYVQQYVNMPQVRVPDFDVPTDPTQLHDTTIDELAAETRRFWGLGNSPISNVTWLLENNGAVVARFELLASTLDAFSEWVPQENRPYVILGSDKGSAARSRFDAAHELGHVILHRNLRTGSLSHKDLFLHIERQAHRFAAAFLLPEETFGAEVSIPSLDALRTLKERWRVSIAAMIVRLKQLEIVDSEQEKRLWMNMGRRKWRSKEPLDDILEPEQPRYLRRCVEVLVSKGLISGLDIPASFGIPSTDVEQLLGLEQGFLDRAGQSIDLKTPAPAGDESEPRIFRFPGA